MIGEWERGATRGLVECVPSSAIRFQNLVPCILLVVPIPCHPSLDVPAGRLAAETRLLTESEHYGPRAGLKRASSRPSGPRLSREYNKTPFTR